MRPLAFKAKSRFLCKSSVFCGPRAKIELINDVREIVKSDLLVPQSRKKKKRKILCGMSTMHARDGVDYSSRALL
jgi:hypothetical protein